MKQDRTLAAPAALKALAIVTILSLPCLAPAARAGTDGTIADNIFSPSPQDAAAPPTFSNTRRPSESSSAMIGDAMEDTSSYVDLVRSLPTLTPQQRKDLDKLFQDRRKDAQPLQDELRSVRDQLRTAKETGRLTALDAALGDGSEKTAPTIAPPPQAGAWLPGQATIISDLSARADCLERELRESKQRLWIQMRALLSQDQIQDMDRMRKGTLILPGELDPQPLPRQETPAIEGQHK